MVYLYQKLDRSSRDLWLKPRRLTAWVKTQRLAAG
jgi:hypothetical protein